MKKPVEQLIICHEELSRVASGFRVKDLFKPAFLFVILFNCQTLKSQGRTDTISTISHQNTTSWAYKMQTSGEKWVRETSKKDFQIFIRYQRNKSNIISANVSYYGAATLFWLNGIKEIELAATGITPQNAKDFIYHIVENDSLEVVPWTKPLNFRSNKKLTYAYLGKFNTDKRILKLEIYKVNSYYDRATLICNGLYMPPATVNFIELAYTNEYLFKPHMQHHIPFYKQKYYSEKDWKNGKTSFKWADSINQLVVCISPTLQNDMYSVYLKRVVDGKVDTMYISNSWEMSYYRKAPHLRINASYFNKPGNYEIIVVPEAPDDFKRNSMSNAVIVPFKVLPSDTTVFTSKQMVSYIVSLLLIGGVVFAFYYLRSKRKLAQEARQKEIANWQLSSVRAQLNPHFMFNALAGIQNLINKSDMSAANRYLTKFARITRSVLDEEHKDTVSIADEIRFIEDYLQMEQLRFGFQYSISVVEGINQSNIEIPSMLLQPFVENAVKHGVSALSAAGFIKVRIYTEKRSLIMTVADNGPGFKKEKTTEGKGIRLSGKRIELLNTLHYKDAISVDTRSGADGTTIILQLNNWV